MRRTSLSELSPASRQPNARYIDPLAAVWLRCAHQIGWRVDRSGEVFASWDGVETLTIGAAADLDPDDHIGQMILHEICHALIEGPAGWRSVDWGLENRDHRDLDRELATHRLQALWADRVGLRQLFAVTTDWRAYYDLLPPDPLAPLGAVERSRWCEAWTLDASTASTLDERAVMLAAEGLRRAHTLEWSAPLTAALHLTAELARIARLYDDPNAQLTSLWCLDHL